MFKTHGNLSQFYPRPDILTKLIAFFAFLVFK